MSETTTHGHAAAKKVEPPFSGPLASLEAWLYDMVYEKIPFKLPKGVQDILVQFAPWISLIGAILMLPVVFTIFGLGAVVSYYGAVLGMAYGPMHYIAVVILIVQVILMFLAVSPLLKHQRKGWQLLFYSSTISVVYSLVDSFGYGYFAIMGLIWGLIGAAISYYVLFQLRAHYKS